MGIDLSKIRNENARLKSQGSGGSGSFLDNFVKMPEGEGFVTVRILPPMDGFDLPYAVTRTHKLGQKNFHCLCTLVGDRWEGRCPICDYYRFLWRESDGTNDSDMKNKLIAEARGIKPIERFYYNVMVIQQGQPHLGPKILSIGKQLHRLITVAMGGDPEDPNDPGLGDVTDPFTGRNLKIRKEITKGSDGAYPSYNGSKFLAESVLGTQAEIDTWLANRHDLHALRQVKTADELRREIRIFRGLEKDPSVAFDEDDFRTPAAAVSVPVSVAPARPQPQAQPKPQAKPVDVDTDLDPDDDFMAELRNM